MNNSDSERDIFDSTGDGFDGGDRGERGDGFEGGDRGDGFEGGDRDDEGLDEMEIYEEDLASSSSTPSTETEELFDEIVGHIEDIIMDDDFQVLQNSFMEEYYEEFEDAEENKFIYTDIHHNYVQSLEHFMEQQLCRRMPGFSMSSFMSELSRQRKELEGEIFEMLLTFTDFEAFKEMMLDYRSDKEGRGIDLSDGICITSMPR